MGFERDFGGLGVPERIAVGKARWWLTEQLIVSYCGFKHGNRFRASAETKFSSCLHTSPVHAIAGQVDIPEHGCDRHGQEVSDAQASTKDVGRPIRPGSNFFSISIRPTRHTGQS